MEFIWTNPDCTDRYDGVWRAPELQHRPEGPELHLQL